MVSFTGVVHKYLKSKLQIFAHLETVSLGGFNKTVQNGICFGTFYGIGGNPILPAKSKWPDSLFGRLF